MAKLPSIVAREQSVGEFVEDGLYFWDFIAEGSISAKEVHTRLCMSAQSQIDVWAYSFEHIDVTDALRSAVTANSNLRVHVLFPSQLFFSDKSTYNNLQDSHWLTALKETASSFPGRVILKHIEGGVQLPDGALFIDHNASRCVTIGSSVYVEHRNAPMFSARPMLSPRATFDAAWDSDKASLITAL